MLKKIERNITAQLLIFYVLFVLPLFLGGVELFIFQSNALQQSVQRTDSGLTQAIALIVEANVQSASSDIRSLSYSAAAQQFDMHQLLPVIATDKLVHPTNIRYTVCTASGRLALSYPVSQETSDTKCGQATFIQQILASQKPVVSVAQFMSTTQNAPFSIGTRILRNNQPVGIIITDVSLSSLSNQLMKIQQQLVNSNNARLWVINTLGQPLVATPDTSDAPNTALNANLLKTLPDITRAFGQSSQSGTLHEQDSTHFYSYLAVAETPWVVAVVRPPDIMFTIVTGFQHSLILALVMLLVGASLFWIAMHGWVVAPLSHLAQAVAMIRPDQTTQVMESKLFTRERNRRDEVGRLIAAFTSMEAEIHELFRKSDEQSQARLHTLDAIMSSMDEGVLLESPEGQIVYANHSYIQFVGITPQEMLHKDTLDADYLSSKLTMLMEEPEVYEEAIRQIEPSDELPVIEFQVKGYYNRMGQFVPTLRDIRMHLFQVCDETGELIGRGRIFNDVTRRNEAERVKKNLLAIVSHELRTPLTAIKGYATSLLETDVEVDSTVQTRFLRRIVEEGDRMADLVTNLLEMSQLEAGILKLIPSLFHIESLIEQVITDEKRHLVRLDIAANVPLLYADRRRLEMVLRNLLENAWRYAGSEAVIEIAARYNSEQEQRQERGLYLTIMDSGPGFPEHLAERIFDRFYQIDEGRKRSSNGVGLGLAICRGFIEAHGGRIWAENRSNGGIGAAEAAEATGVTGAIFHIWLPAKVLYIAGTQTELFELGKAL